MPRFRPTIGPELLIKASQNPFLRWGRGVQEASSGFSRESLEKLCQFPSQRRTHSDTPPALHKAADPMMTYPSSANSTSTSVQTREGNSQQLSVVGSVSHIYPPLLVSEPQSKDLHTPPHILSPPSSQSYAGMSRTARLEAKIRDLEASIRQAEAAASRSAVVAKGWSNPILNGDQEIPRARMDLQPLIISYPVAVREESMFTSYGFGFEGVGSELAKVSCTNPLI